MEFHGARSVSLIPNPGDQRKEKGLVLELTAHRRCVVFVLLVPSSVIWPFPPTSEMGH